MKKNKNNQKVKKALENKVQATRTGNKKLKESADQILKEESVKESKGIHRALLIQMGLYGAYKPKVFKSKKAYNRRKKDQEE
jgi:hypothetical protein